MSKKFKLLLIQPPVEDFYDTDVRLQPIGLAFLKAAVNKSLPFVDAKIIDFHHGWGRKTLAVPKELTYLKPYYPVHDASPFSVFYQYYRFGADNQSILNQIIEEKPDMIGISSLFSAYYREVLSIADLIKSYMNIPVLIGGSHVSAYPESMLKHDSVDFILQGEAEKTLPDFLSLYISDLPYQHCPGLGFKSEGKMQINPKGDGPELEDLPIPDLSDLAPQKYLYDGKPMCCLVTSRSCPHRCGFCSVHLTFGTNYRNRSPKHIIDEILKRYQEGYRVFDFEDDNLTFYKNEMHELLDEIEKQLPIKELQFVAMNGISYLSLDKELLLKMKRVGFTHLNLSLVTSDKAVRESTKRPHTVEKYLEIVSIGQELGFKMVSYQILGIPSESLDSMLQTLSFNAQLPVLLGASMYYDAPSISRPIEMKTDSDLFKIRLSAMAIESETAQREDIYSLFVVTRIINFLKGLPIDDSLEWNELLEKFIGLPEAQDLSRIHAILMGDDLRARDTSSTVLSKFRISIFHRVIKLLDTIVTQNGYKITGMKEVIAESESSTLV